MKLHILISVLFCMLLIPTLICCSPADHDAGGTAAVSYDKDAAQNTISFTDATGELVAVRYQPRNVAVLFSSFADIWTTAGGDVSITVGESVTRGFAASDAVLVDSGAGHTTIDLEALIAAEPDLVIGTADYDCQADAIRICRENGIPAALFRVETLDDYLSLLALCTRITGNPTAYDAFGTAVKTRADEILALAAAETGRTTAPSVLFIRAGSGEKSTKAKTSRDTFAAAMLTELGAQNIADTDTALTGTLSLEAILLADPDCMFITTMGDETAAMDYMTTLLSSTGWQSLTCVREGRVFFLPKELFHFKPNARWDEAYRYLASLLYPALALP